MSNASTRIAVDCRSIRPLLAMLVRPARAPSSLQRTQALHSPKLCGASSRMKSGVNTSFLKKWYLITEFDPSHWFLIMFFKRL